MTHRASSQCLRALAIALAIPAGAGGFAIPSPAQAAPPDAARSGAGSNTPALFASEPWSNPRFFPIAVWLQPPKTAPRFREAGINTFVGMWQGPTEEQLAGMKSTGLYLVCAPTEAALRHRADSYIIAWMHDDEPDNARGFGTRFGWTSPLKPAQLQSDYRRMRAADPARPVLANFGQGVAWDPWRGRGSRRNHPEDYAEYLKGCDIACFDIYPVNHTDPEVAGDLSFVARGVERLLRWGDGTKRVWACLECTAIEDPAKKPTPQQVRAEAWMALIKGARGLMYFVHQFKPQFREAALLDDPVLLSAVTKLNRQITELAPVLNSPAITNAVMVSTENPRVPIGITVRRYEGDLYLFCAAMKAGTNRATFRVGPNFDGRKVEVLGEDRALEVRDGAFADPFESWDVHLYRVR
jgi:hypothetical protein